MGHGSHGSHSSHSQHANSDAHTNSVSSVNLSKSDANNHTASIGGVDWSGSFNNSSKLGVYGSSGSLTQLIDIVNNMRSRPTNTSYADNTNLNSVSSTGSIPTRGTAITSSSVNSLVNYGGSSYNARYQPYTLNLNTSASVTSNGSGVSGNTTNSGSGVTKTQDISGNLSTTTKTWTNEATGLAGTKRTYTYTDNLGGAVIKSASTYSPTFSESKGTRVTKAQADYILSVLQDSTLTNWTGPASKTFSWTGSNTIAHSNTHSNHSSYGS